MAAAQDPPPPVEGAAEPTTTAEPAGLDRLYEQMGQMAQQQQQFMQSVTERLTPPEEEEEVEFYTEEGDLSEEGARALISDLVREQVDSQMAPREAARLIRHRDEAYEALKEEYPELQDPKVADAVLQRALQWASGANKAIIDRPEFVDVIEAFYKSTRYDELRAAEAAEQPRPVVLESGTGAARQTQQQGPDWGDRIVKAAESLRPQI